MLGKALMTSIFVLLLAAPASWAQGIGYGGVPPHLLMPGPPSQVTATAGNGRAAVSFSPPKSNGGRPITHYTVTAHPGKIEATGKHSPIIVKGLTNGTTYTFTVTATNSVGTGPASKSCNSVTPKGQ